MTDNTSNCKGCSASVRVSEAEVRRMLDEMKLTDAEIVSQDTYETRLSICRECDSLQFKTTCRHCGCLIAIRAWLTDKPCPHPVSSKW